MDEAIEIYTKRVIQDYKAHVEYINDRYPGYAYSQMRRELHMDFKNIAIGKVNCLEDLKHITCKDAELLIEKVRGVKFDASESK